MKISDAISLLAAKAGEQGHGGSLILEGQLGNGRVVTIVVGLDDTAVDLKATAYALLTKDAECVIGQTVVVTPHGEHVVGDGDKVH